MTDDANERTAIQKSVSEQVLEYKLLEYQTCTDLGSKGLEQLNRLAIASLIFNGTLAAALGFATDQLTDPEKLGAAERFEIALTVGLVALLVVAVTFNLGAATANRNFWRMLLEIGDRHVAVDREIRELLNGASGDSVLSEHTVYLSNVARNALSRRRAVSPSGAEKPIEFRWSTRFLTVFFYGFIILGWIGYIGTVIWTIWSGDGTVGAPQ